MRESKGRHCNPHAHGQGVGLTIEQWKAFSAEKLSATTARKDRPQLLQCLVDIGLCSRIYDCRSFGIGLGNQSVKI